MEEHRTELKNLLEKLNDNQIEYLYHLVCNLFGYAPD